MVCADVEDASQMSPSQSIISGLLQHKRCHVSDTVDISSMPWPNERDTELKGTHYSQGKNTYFSQDYIVETVQKFKETHSTAQLEKDIPHPPPPTPSKKMSRRKAKRGAHRD